MGLRAGGVGDEKDTNPNAFIIRQRFHKLYYHFKPGKIYWIVYILARKFCIAFAALMFRGNPGFQLSFILLVLFCCFVLQVKHRPFMSSMERDKVLESHQEKVDQGDPFHQLLDKRMASAMRKKEIRERRERRRKELGIL